VKYPIIALITDFGEDDFFVASLKAVILTINPSARIIDITHRIPSFDIMTAGFFLFSCYRYFPAGTIFLVIVDPGVGSSRKILLADTRKYFFIAPDNGVLSWVLEGERVQLREVKSKKYFLPQLSRTFEGRDKMAPAAAWLSKGVSSAEFGPEVSVYRKFKIERPKIRGKEIIGHVLYIDKFGNLITNIPGKMLDLLHKEKGKKSFSLYSGSRKVVSYKESYSSAKKGEPLFLIGSLGFVEISCCEASASEKLKIKTGGVVRIAAKSQRIEPKFKKIRDK